MGDQQTSNPSEELHQVEKEYKREVAITEARPLLYKIVFILWILFDVALVGLLILVTVSYLLFGQWNDRTSTAGLISNLSSIHSAAQSNSASSLFVGDTTVLSSGDGYDFYVELENPNSDWYANFEYSFVSSAGETDTYHGFVFPGETRILIVLNEEFDSSPSRAEMSVSSISWQRMDAHTIDDISLWYEDHSDFEISDALHGTVDVAGTKVVRSSFTVKNNTPYGYWSAPFILTLERNGIPVGVNQVSIAGFESGETREVDINWFDDTPSSGDLIIQPSIDYLDKDVYMEATSDTEIDVRDVDWD